MLQPQFEADLKQWLNWVTYNPDMPSGHSIRHTLHKNRIKGVERDPMDEFADSVVTKLQATNPLLTDIFFKREMRVTPTPGRLDYSLNQNLTQLWGAMSHVMYKKRWTVMQWVPTSMLPQETRNTTQPPKNAQNQTSSQNDVVYTDQTESKLMNLPGEVRNLIWRFALVEGAPPKLDDAGFSPVVLANKYKTVVGDSLKAREKPVTPPPALMTTCRQVQKETLAVYYTENIFAIALDSRESYEAACHWLFSLKNRDIACLRGLVLQGLCVSNRTPGLRSNDETHAIRMFVDFHSLTVRHELSEEVDSEKQRLVMEYTLARVRKYHDADVGITRRHIDLILLNFAKCCTTPQSEESLPVLATGSHWQKSNAKWEQVGFIDDTITYKGGMTEADLEGDSEPPEFAIW